MKYYTALKRNELPSHEKKLNCILLFQRSQYEMARTDYITFWEEQNYGES